MVVGAGGVVSLSIKLDEKVTGEGMNQLALSNDGTFCAIGAGQNKAYFYLIDLESQSKSS